MASKALAMMEMRRIWVLAIAVTALAAVPFGAGPALAQSSDTVTIGSEADAAGGRIAVNAAAGVYNQQVNAATISQSENALAANIVTQALIGNSVCTRVDNECGSSDQHAEITGAAFAGANGSVAVNGAAGTENQQANLAVFGISNGIDGRVATLNLLSQIRASQEPAGDQDAPAAEKTANISSQAFTDASGLVQVNLTAGERNSSANLFGLTVTGGAD